MRRIDIHQHLWDYTWLPRQHRMGMAIRAAARRKPPVDPMTIFPRVGNGFMDPTGQINVNVLDRMGFDIGVAQVVDWGVGYKNDGYEDAETPIDEINRLTGEAIKMQNGRLRFFCGIDPRRDNAADRVRKYIREYGAIGFKLYPPMGYYPFEDFCEPIYKVLIEEDVPVLAHTQAGHKQSEPLHWAEVVKKFPDLKVILGHAGVEAPFWSRYGWEQAVIVAGRAQNVYLDPTEWQIQGALKPRNVADLVERIKIMQEVVGTGRLVFGSDNPLGKGGSDGSNDTELLFIYKNLATIGKWFNCPFTQEDVDMFLGGAAEKLLKLEPADSAFPAK